MPAGTQTDNLPASLTDGPPAFATDLPAFTAVLPATPPDLPAFTAGLPAFATDRSAQEADSALKRALHTEDRARKCAVLWFAEIRDRKLYRELGYSSMPQYARRELGFSDTRVGDFMRLTRKLDQLPAVKAALPEIGYTKAREIIAVASPRTEGRWVAEARVSSRRALAEKVKRVKSRAKAQARGRRPAAGLFAPAETVVGRRSSSTPAEMSVELRAGSAAAAASAEAVVEPLTEPLAESLAAAEVPVRVSVELMPEQFARWEVLLEKLARSGVTGDRAELLFDALACKLDDLNSFMTENKAETAPRGASRTEIPTQTSVPVVAHVPFQIHVHRCPDCGKMEIGGRPLGSAGRERIACDAAVSTPGERNQTTIPPRVRREVLARDRHRCRAPGCGRTRFLEVHHIKPRNLGGTNDPANLITLCAACHQLWHERGGVVGGGSGEELDDEATRAERRLLGRKCDLDAARESARDKAPRDEAGKDGSRAREVPKKSLEKRAGGKPRQR
jgi:hypothetical protein